MAIATNNSPGPLIHSGHSSGRLGNPACRLAACTIISRNYLSHAKILAQSFVQHQPDGRFFVLVVDRLPNGVSADANIHILDPDELALPYFYEMCFKYDVTELCTALKPCLLALLLDRYADEVVYFDP